jgi:hypothetical protein
MTKRDRSGLLPLQGSCALRCSSSSVDAMKLWNNLVFLQIAAVVSALILTLGAVIEYWDKLRLLWLLSAKWILRKSTPFDRCVFWKLLLHSVGPILVVLGIAGEFVFEGRTFVVEDRQEIKAKGDIASLQNQSSAFVLEAAQRRKEAEAEHLARVKIEATVAWRSFSKEQQSIFSDNLKLLAGLKVGVSYLNGEAEGLGFANDIATALRAAKWSVFSPREPFTQFGGFGGGIIPLESLTGVNVSNTGNRLGRDAADAIQHELCSLGFDTTITRKPQAFGPGDPKIDVEVLIVGRPPTQQGLTQLSIDASKAMKTCRGSQ